MNYRKLYHRLICASLDGKKTKCGKRISYPCERRSTKDTYVEETRPVTCTKCKYAGEK